MLILKRTIQERWVNNYNPEMLTAWNANMDIQLALDPYAIITYIVSYVSKDESGMTKFLQVTLKANVNKPTAELLKALKIAFLTNRQMGLSEAVYKVLPSLRLRGSNVTCIYCATDLLSSEKSLIKILKKRLKKTLNKMRKSLAI